MSRKAHAIRLLLVSISSILLSATGCHWVQNIPLQPPAPPSPVVKKPSGARVYVTDKDSRVVAIRVDDNKIAEQFPVEQGAGGVVVSPDNLLLYASAKAKDYVRIFQTTGEPVGRISTGKGPAGIEMSRDGKFLYTANAGADTVSVLNLKERREVRTIPTGRQPLVVSLSPDNKTLYVLCHQDNEVHAYDTKSGSERAQAKVGVDPFGLAADPQGKYVYVSSFDTNDVVVLSADDLAEVAHVKVGDGAYEVLAAKDGQIYVGCVEENAVVAFRREEWTAEAKATPVGARPYGLGLSPDENTLYVALEGDSKVSVRALPSLDDKGSIDLGVIPVDVFSGR